MNKKEIFEYIDDHLEHVSKDQWINMIGSYLNTDQLNDLLDVNELSPRFNEETE